MKELKEPSADRVLSWFNKRLSGTAMPGARMMMKKAISELEYRVPKKPEVRHISLADVPACPTWPACPTCMKILKEEYDYCPTCGQAIDWPDQEEK